MWATVAAAVQAASRTRRNAKRPRIRFDYGDDWQFRVEVIGRNVKQPGVRYPRLVKSVGKAPAQYSDAEEE